MAPKKPHIFSKSISCSEAEWAIVKEKATADGYRSASNWLVDQAINETPPDDKPDSESGGLTPEEERHQYNLVKSFSKEMDDQSHHESEVGKDSFNSRDLLILIYLMLRYRMEQDMGVEVVGQLFGGIGQQARRYPDDEGVTRMEVKKYIDLLGLDKKNPEDARKLLEDLLAFYKNRDQQQNSNEEE
jgi:hypothetical protein